jgi:hypothetical protein
MVDPGIERKFSTGKLALENTGNFPGNRKQARRFSSWKKDWKLLETTGKQWKFQWKTACSFF